MNFILASGSPRRKELMEMLGVKNLKIIPAKGEENPPAGASPEELVMALAAAKAEEVAIHAGEDDVVVAADTIVWLEGRPFGKPHSREHAIEMLQKLSGNTHHVYTGVAVLRHGTERLGYECTAVHFRDIPQDEIERYVMSGEPMDKAGAYGAQGLGALFVRGIEGDFFNVMGLPLCRLDAMLKEQGVGLL